MLDAVQDHILVVAENDIAVFAHDLNDQLLLAQIAQDVYKRQGQNSRFYAKNVL